MAGASLVNLLAVRWSLQPADADHRFGHGKAQPLAALGQAAFIAGSAVFLGLQAHRIAVAVEQRIRDRWPQSDIIIYQDPVSLGVDEAEPGSTTTSDRPIRSTN
jgi:divalent metal cation (Fe/Co/Zn/Cd) transporter